MKTYIGLFFIINSINLFAQDWSKCTEFCNIEIKNKQSQKITHGWKKAPRQKAITWVNKHLKKKESWGKWKRWVSDIKKNRDRGKISTSDINKAINSRQTFVDGKPVTEYLLQSTYDVIITDASQEVIDRNDRKLLYKNAVNRIKAFNCNALTGIQKDFCIVLKRK